MTDGDVTVPVVCPACDTRTEVPVSTLEDTITRHNETQHDGTDVATVDPAIKEQIAELVAEDLGLLDGGN